MDRCKLDGCNMEVSTEQRAESPFLLGNRGARTTITDPKFGH